MMTLVTLLAEIDPQHPVLPEDARWTGVVIIVALALLLAAAAVGTAVHLNRDEKA